MEEINRDISEKHEEALKILLNFKEDNPEFTFGFRTQNNSNRLKKGFWFHGNDDYVAIPLFTGRDWKNRTPNIYFRILLDGSCFLEISVSDSPEKRFLAERIVKNISGLKKSKKGYFKPFFNEDYREALKTYLKTDNAIIQELIRVNSKIIDPTLKRYNIIDVFTQEEFDILIERVNSFRKADLAVYLPEFLNKIKIQSAVPKMKIEIKNIPRSARWIFFTGKNGMGKSSVLKAITFAILGGKMEISKDKSIFSMISDSADIELTIQRGSNSKKVNLKHGLSNIKKLPLSGFSAYGPMRHRSMTDVERNIENSYMKIALGRSMFEDDALMLSLDHELMNSNFPNQTNHFLNVKVPNYIVKQILEILPDLIPQLISIDAPEIITIKDLWSETSYIFEDEEGNRFNGVQFEELSSGHKNLIGFLSDMLIRLISQQRNITYLSELKGVVIIDEIDIHLHPHYQRSLVEVLADKFPDIQFIVSTHSPIPLLGAPKESLFISISRNVKNGIHAEVLDLNISNLLPNSILSSPIFDFENLIPQNHDQSKKVRTENSYEEIIKRDEVRSFLKNVAQKLKK